MSRVSEIALIPGLFLKSVQLIFPRFDCTKNGKIPIQDFVRLVQPQPQSIGMFWLFH
jgi:hypothetical protein